MSGYRTPILPCNLPVRVFGAMVSLSTISSKAKTHPRSTAVIAALRRSHGCRWISLTHGNGERRGSSPNEQRSASQRHSFFDWSSCWRRDISRNCWGTHGSSGTWPSASRRSSPSFRRSRKCRAQPPKKEAGGGPCKRFATVHRWGPGPDKRGDRGRSRTVGRIERGGGDGGDPARSPV
jgi:hypothetical protein